MSAPTFMVNAACVRGVEAHAVRVEVSMAPGIPSIQIVGMADAAILEARSRIRCALRASGFEIPRKSITVNLAPGDMRKSGSGFDLPIAVAILAVSGQIPIQGFCDVLFAGELALDGTICQVKGEVAYQILARDSSLALVGSRQGHHVEIDGAGYLAVDNLSRLASGLRSAACSPPLQALSSFEAYPGIDFTDVSGQEIAKRALAIAAAGDLGLLMIGVPGSGKTMLAKRMATILPAIDPDTQQEALCAHSVAGEDVSGILRGMRPFRAPHHSISAAGLVGGGRPVRPGEITLAHGGVLFLDELAEFSPHTLQMLRQPMEEGQVRIVRADGLYRFPSRFQFLAASNPCPCGFLGDASTPCTCPATAVERYRRNLGGPLMDRIDMVIDVVRPEAKVILTGAEGLSSRDLRNMVERGRSFRSWRAERAEPRSGEGSGIEGMAKSFELDDEAARKMQQMASGLNLTGRGLERLLCVARTIADMDESCSVGAKHVLEAAMFRGRRER